MTYERVKPIITALAGSSSVGSTWGSARTVYDATRVGDTVVDYDQRRFSPLFPSYRSAFADLFGLRFVAVGAPIEKVDPLRAPGSAVVQQANKRGAPKGSWLEQMLTRKPRMLLTVALANKMARIIWALLVKQENYRAPVPAERKPGGPEVVGDVVGRRRAWHNSRRDEAERTRCTHRVYRARVYDLVPVCELPYRPAAPSLHHQRPDRWQHPTTCRSSSKNRLLSRGVHR
jgi:hypothetical protein